MLRPLSPVLEFAYGCYIRKCLTEAALIGTVSTVQSSVGESLADDDLVETSQSVLNYHRLKEDSEA